MKPSQDRSAIGGDFELSEVAFGARSVFDSLTRGLDGTWVASGRSALGIILEELKAQGVHHVHLPSYLCHSILLPIRRLGLSYSFYPVHEGFVARPDPPEGSAVLLIHYMGWINQATEALRAEAGKRYYLIEDATQTLLSDWGAEPGTGRFVLFSARKFAPVSFGGWCNVVKPMRDPSPEAEMLAWSSMAARLVRGAYLSQRDAPISLAVEDFYMSALHRVEIWLDEHPLDAGISQMVLDQLSGINWADVSVRRRENWLHLNVLLDKTIWSSPQRLDQGVVPFGFMVETDDRDQIRTRLAAARIFCPIHWQLPDEIDVKTFPQAVHLSRRCMTIPIDQRYGVSEMRRIAEILSSSGGNAA